MKNWKSAVICGALLVAGCAVLGWTFAAPVAAQIRAALVRNVDTPELSPFHAAAEYSLTYSNVQRLLATVPAGKRLVIDYLSYYSGGVSSDELVFCSLRAGEFGPSRVYIEIHPPHLAATAGFSIQDGSQPVKAYFEAGEEVWVSASHNTVGSRSMSIYLFGHLITP